MKLEVKYGLLIGFAGFLWTIAEMIIGLHSNYIQYHPVITNFYFLIPIIGLFLAIKDKRDIELNGKMPFADGLKTGVYISIVVGALAVPSQYIFHSYINTTYFEKMIAYSRNMAEESGKSAEQITTQLQGMESMMNINSYMFFSFISVLGIGFFFTFLWSAILTRNYS